MMQNALLFLSGIVIAWLVAYLRDAWEMADALIDSARHVPPK